MRSTFSRMRGGQEERPTPGPVAAAAPARGSVPAGDAPLAPAPGQPLGELLVRLREQCGKPLKLEAGQIKFTVTYAEIWQAPQDVDLDAELGVDANDKPVPEDPAISAASDKPALVHFFPADPDSVAAKAGEVLIGAVLMRFNPTPAEQDPRSPHLSLWTAAYEAVPNQQGAWKLKQVQYKGWLVNQEGGLGSLVDPSVKWTTRLSATRHSPGSESWTVYDPGRYVYGEEPKTAALQTFNLPMFGEFADGHARDVTGVPAERLDRLYFTQSGLCGAAGGRRSVVREWEERGLGQGGRFLDGDRDVPK